MPRRGRCLLPEIPCHVTQRGVDRREAFFPHVSGQDQHDIVDMEWWRRQARVKWRS
ncbi:MAG: hypothetical protein WA463_04350 [Terriglobales bacterium]